jgi:hypothetical protein
VVTGVDPDRTGVMLGSGIGGAETWQEEYPRYIDKGPGRVSPMFVPKMLSNTGAGTVAIRTGARGPNMTVNTACAAGASAIAHGARPSARRFGRRNARRRVEAGITGTGGERIRADGCVVAQPGSRNRVATVRRGP